MIIVDGERLQIKGSAEIIKQEMATLLYGMQDQCPELLAQCVDFLENLDKAGVTYTIKDYKRRN